MHHEMLLMDPAPSHFALTPENMEAPEGVMPGVCRYCGCSDLDACLDKKTDSPCSWMDHHHTICSACISDEAMVADILKFDLALEKILIDAVLKENSRDAMELLCERWPLTPWPRAIRCMRIHFNIPAALLPAHEEVTP